MLNRNVKPSLWSAFLGKSEDRSKMKHILALVFIGFAMLSCEGLLNRLEQTNIRCSANGSCCSRFNKNGHS